MNSFVLGLIVRMLGSEELQDEAAAFVADALEPLLPESVVSEVLGDGLVNLGAALKGMDPSKVDPDTLEEQ